LSMRRIKQVLRLKHVQGLPERAIARTLGVRNGVAHGFFLEYDRGTESTRTYAAKPASKNNLPL